MVHIGHQPRWDDAQTYVAWLSKLTGQPYRLLTEAEWEYAARAGATTPYFWGDEIGKGNANCDGCDSQWDGTAPVGSFKPNEFDLYDMAGNVWQSVEDCYHDGYNEAPTDGSAWTGDDCSRRVVRGGSWNFHREGIRSASRFGIVTDDVYGNQDFRVGRTLTPSILASLRRGARAKPWSSFFSYGFGDRQLQAHRPGDRSALPVPGMARADHREIPQEPQVGA